MKIKNDTLRRHLALVEELERKFYELSDRRAKFAQRATEADRVGIAAQALKAERQELLGRVALDGADRADLGKLDARIREAEHAAASDQESAEIARAGMSRLDRELEAASAELTHAHKQTAAVRYQAGVELAQASLEGYRMAYAALAKAHAQVLAACLAADDFANPQEKRVFVLGSFPNTMKFDAPILPHIADIDLNAWRQDIAEATATELRAARAALS